MRMTDRRRLAALRETGLLDSPQDPAFDRLTRMASRLLDAPTALVSLVAGDHQFFKSQIGLEEPLATLRRTPLSHSFCQHAVATGEPLLVEDAPDDPRVRDNGAVKDFGAISYAGCPLITSAGYALGTVCVFDAVPRRWSQREVETLSDLADLAMTEIELRAATRSAADSSARLAAQNQVLQLIAGDASLEEILDALASSVEARSPGVRCSVLVADPQGTALLGGAAPSLPDAYREAVEGLAIDPRSGPSGAAAAIRRRVVVPDAVLDHRWGDFRTLARGHGVGAYWSTAIRSGEEVLGTITLLHREPHMPSQAELALVDEAAHLASVAIERRGALARLEHQADTDRLTGLPNRAGLLKRLGASLDRAARDDAPVAVFFVDVDRFKLLNDSLGHRAGDDVLVSIADRLRAATRPDDVVARLGGDEFVVVCENLSAPDVAQRLGARIVEACAAPVDAVDEPLVVTVSVGIALSSTTAVDADELLRAADAAMYRAKAAGANRVQLFDEDVRDRASARLRLETALRRALDEHQLALAYQPLIDVATGAVVGAEALVRWHHADRGVVSPADFIPVAEESGLIVPLGRWVLERACADAARWADEVPGGADLKINVNVSARQFAADDRLVETVADVLDRTGLDASRLVLEITESAVLHDGVEEAIQALTDLGVSATLDDFGTGYSSLGRLMTLPIAGLKIDRTFIDGLGEHEAKTAVVEAILAMARALGVGVTAEGVESADQHEALRARGCETAQGFLFARPMPVAEFERRLTAPALRIAA
jgi:diguanylate cyclase (GGDEF)-like protein